jgi:hypothetical protein
MVFFFFFSFCGPGDSTQSLVFSPVSHTPSPFSPLIFETRPHYYLCLGWPHTPDPPASATSVVGITGMRCHTHCSLLFLMCTYPVPEGRTHTHKPYLSQTSLSCIIPHRNKSTQLNNPLFRLVYAFFLFEW